MQKRINDYISSGNGDDVAFVELKELPTYTACMLKKNIETNDDEIFNKVTSSGTPYYKYYTITKNDEEKVYVASFSEAEKVINNLKSKNSANTDKLGIVEKYETAKAEFKTVDTCVSELYEKKVVVTKKASSTSTYKNIGTRVVTGETSVPTNLGVSLIKPISGVISSRYGIRWRDNHKGLDIAAPKGTAIKAAAGGKVIFSGYGSGSNSYSGYGNIVVIQSTSSLVIRYGHCSALYVKTGETVVQGQVIAAVGSTGISTGNHLHFEIRYKGTAVNPQNYIYK